MYGDGDGEDFGVPKTEPPMSVVQDASAWCLKPDTPGKKDAPAESAGGGSGNAIPTSTHVGAEVFLQVFGSGTIR